LRIGRRIFFDEFLENFEVLKLLVKPLYLFEYALFEFKLF